MQCQPFLSRAFARQVVALNRFYRTVSAPGICEPVAIGPMQFRLWKAFESTKRTIILADFLGAAGAPDSVPYFNRFSLAKLSGGRSPSGASLAPRTSLFRHVEEVYSLASS